MNKNRETLMKFISAQNQKVQDDISKQGYKDNSPYRDNSFNIIQGTPQGTSITMDDVSKRLYATDGKTSKILEPNSGTHFFSGPAVKEIALAKYGGLLNKTIKCSNCGWSWKAADGGNDVSTCHKCGTENKIMENGGPTSNIKNWFAEQMQSSVYRRNLERSGYKDVDAEIAKRLSNINKTKYIADENRLGTYYNPGSRYIHHAPLKDIENWEGNAPESEYILAHEFGHSGVAKGSGTRLNKYDIEQLGSRNKNKKSYPWENYADLKAAQYEAAKLGIYNPGTEEFTQEHLDLLKKNGNIDRLFENYDDKDIIWLQNNLAQVDNQSSLPIAQFGRQTFKTSRDSVAHQADKILKYEQLRGSETGSGLSIYQDPKYKDQLMNEIYPRVSENVPYGSAMEHSEMMDFIFNTGKDARVFAYQEYLRKKDPNNSTGWQDSEGKWKDRKNIDDATLSELYNNSIGKLPENKRRQYINLGRDWYYKNTAPKDSAYGDWDLKSEGPHPAYNNTWYGRIWNTNDYKPFDPNNPKFTPKKQMGGAGMMYADRNYQVGGNAEPTYSYPLRDKLYPGEDEYFKAHPEVGGMAAEDNQVIINPYSSLTDEEKQGIIINESARLAMRNGYRRPTFDLTPEQKEAFKDYSTDEQDIRETIIGRILSGDTSAKNVTLEQKKYAEELQKVLKFQVGGESSMAENGDRATRADSLFLLKNNKIINNLLKSGYKWTSKNNTVARNKILWNNTYDILKKDLPKNIKKDLKNEQKTKTYNTYIDKRGKFLGTQDWLSGGGEDYFMPKQYIHPDIIPQYQGDLMRNVKNKPLHNIFSYGYDDLAITPFDMLTPEQQKERVKKYGTDGVPKSYLNKIKPPDKEDKTDKIDKQRPKVEALQSLAPQGVISDFNITAQLPVIRPEARMPKSFDVNSQRQTMSGPSEYYNYSDEGVDFSDALRAKESADAYNQYVQEKYKEAAKTNPKAQKRLEQLMQNIELTPHYQVGGENMYTVSGDQPLIIPSQGSYPFDYNKNLPVNEAGMPYITDTDGKKILLSSARKVPTKDEFGKQLTRNQIAYNQDIWNDQKEAYSPKQRDFNIWKNNPENTQQGFYNRSEYDKIVKKLNSLPTVGQEGLESMNKKSKSSAVEGPSILSKLNPFKEIPGCIYTNEDKSGQKKLTGGLVSYQTAGTVKYGTPEYTEAYNKGEVITDEGVRSPIALDEVVIQNNYRRPRGFWEQSRDKYLKDNKDIGLLGAIGSVVTYPLAVGQHALTYGIEGKVQDPDEAWGYNTDEGWFDSLGAFGRNLVDASLNLGADPSNLFGAGILTKGNAVSKLNKLRNISTSVAPELTEGLATQGFPNPVKIIDDVVPMNLQPQAIVMGNNAGGWNSLSPLNWLPGYGKKLSSKGELYGYPGESQFFNSSGPVVKKGINPMNPNSPAVGFRKFGNSLQDVIDRQALSPKGSGKFSMGRDQIISEGNWAAAGSPDEAYSGVFEATMNPNVIGSKIKQVDMGSKRNGTVYRMTDNNVDIPLTDPGLSFNRRLPFSTRYVKVDKQKLIDGKFQFATQLPHVQSLVEKYASYAGPLAAAGYIANGSEGAKRNVKWLNKYTIDPIIDYVKPQLNAIQYKYGGLTKYQNAGPVKKWLGNTLTPEGYITSTTKGGNYISFTGNDRADDWINKQIDSGKFGFDPKTGGTFPLKKPVKGLSKEDQFIGSETFFNLQAPQGFNTEDKLAQIKKLPEWQQDIINEENTKRRKRVVKDQMDEVYKHPLWYAPGMVAAGIPAVAALEVAGAAAAPYITSALATQLPGMAAVPGATVGNVITAGFAGHGLANVGPDTVEMYKNPSWSNAGSLGMDVLEIAPIAGPAAKTIGEGISSTRKALGTKEGLLSNTYKINPYAERLNDANKSYRVTGLDAFKDFKNTGVVRSGDGSLHTFKFADLKGNFHQIKRPTGFPSFQKGYADMRYAPEEGAVVFETGLPTFKRGEINPVTGNRIRGRHYAHRVINPETGLTMTEIPAADVRVFGDKPHWLKGYQQLEVPALTTEESALAKLGDIRNTGTTLETESLNPITRSIVEKYLKGAEAIQKGIKKVQGLSDDAIRFYRSNNFNVSKRAIEDINAGNKWSRDWYSNPITQKRYDEWITPANKFVDSKTALLYSNLDNTIPGLETINLNKSFSDRLAGTIARNNLEKLITEGKGVEATTSKFLDNSVGRYSHINNDALVDINHPSFFKKLFGHNYNVKNTTIHEDTHFVTKGDKGFKPERLKEIKEPFYKPKDINEKEITNYKYLTKPTEIHARINELRASFNLTPETIVTDKMVDKIINLGLKGKTSVVPDFFKLIKDKNGFKNLMNSLPAFVPIGLTIGTGAAVLPTEKQGGTTSVKQKKALSWLSS